jgi:hypothetical protein
MSYSKGFTKIGSLVMYLTDGRIAGRVESFDPKEDKYILDKMVSGGSRNAYVLAINECKMWRFCNERLPEYASLNGLACLVIHPGYGGFSIRDENDETYETTDRHNPRLVEKAMSLINHEERYPNEYMLAFIPSYMVGYYRITEYDGAELVDLLDDKYKTDEITKIRKGFKNASAQLEDIDRILAMDIKMI